MYLEKESSYHSPDGHHRTEVRSADSFKDLHNGEIEECVKILVALISEEHPTKEFMARMIYRPEDSKQLRRDLYEIVGDGIENIVGRNKELDPDGLKMIIGKECDIQIVHIPNKGSHKFPFCKVVQVKAPGTLVEWPLPDKNTDSDQEADSDQNPDADKKAA